MTSALECQGYLLANVPQKPKSLVESLVAPDIPHGDEVALSRWAQELVENSSPEKIAELQKLPPVARCPECGEQNCDCLARVNVQKAIDAIRGVLAPEPQLGYLVA